MFVANKVLFVSKIHSPIPKFVFWNPYKEMVGLFSMKNNLIYLQNFNWNKVCIVSHNHSAFWNKSQIENLQDSFLKEKKKSQPNRIKTCGSTFKNPQNKKAWELIKQSDCLNLTVGGASISNKHCNFFMNKGNATSSDVEKLIEKVKEKVFLKTGTNLELEIKIIGEK